MRRRLDLQEAWLWTWPIWAFGAARTVVMLLAVLTELAVANEACATGAVRARARGAGAAVPPLVSKRYRARDR